MAYNIIVFVKQVPDTHNITGQAMKEDGTVNRLALPAIFNPEDLNALEMALQVKERYGGKITVISMGPPMAAEVLRESLYRSADKVILISDRKFAGADTLATSYALSCAVQKLGKYDLICCGRQAIDGDTAQVGPQTAEKLKINQVTYVDSIDSINGKDIIVKRGIESGIEVIKVSMPVLLSITSTANFPRPASAKKIMAYKNAKTRTELQSNNQDYLQANQEVNERLLIEEWDCQSIDADSESCGLKGSPTKVRKIDSVVLQAVDTKNVIPTKQGINELVHELIHEHIIG